MKTISSQRQMLLALSAAFMITAAGCSNTPVAEEPAVQNETPAPTPEPTPEPTPTPPAEQFAAPLTGLGLPAALKLRPLMFMVENSPRARPQSGLDQADIVYEVLAEGEITRFLAVYQSRTVDTIGPVRSIRPYFVQLGEELDAVMVHAGWSQEAMNILKSHKLDHFDQVYGDDKYYWRDKSRKAPHNLYSSVPKIREAVTDRKKREDWVPMQLTFAPADAVPVGAPAAKVGIPYIAGYDVAYEYDAASGNYKRFMEGKPHEDRVTGKQLTATSLLIAYTDHRITDKVGRRDVDIYGPGKGLLIYRGVAQEVTWENKDGAIRAYKDGKEAGFLPGQTWVQIVPNNTKVTLE
ncbi:hypothetical protein SY83_02450 [Paenibacillus swuensis]|uniref:Lipoprotein YerB n=1 Tax=Paenibacillus swuensis TaxID=1178515 RepID=A0A172TF13_9BACL|nr:DUF3048 domain-containing protein [Paenibacillus swuensis]ANE45373.1 hypothetical protein SY83_02450 [Paenibacillus swuensis]